MELKENYKTSLKKLINFEKFDLNVFEKLIENCCENLCGENKHYNSLDKDTELIETKELRAALLYIFAEFVRHNKSIEDFLEFLTNDIRVKPEKSKICVDMYRKYFPQIRVALLNIGNHLPHVTDVKWKIDHIVKSNLCGQVEGPMFRICLKTEKYNEETQSSQTEFVNFTCTQQELQDLVFKLKDAVRHCQKLTEH